jgi:hypothetical protein
MSGADTTASNDCVSRMVTGYKHTWKLLCFGKHQQSDGGIPWGYV